MEENIAEMYGDYFYPVILLDKDLKVVYKNEAALAAQIKLRKGAGIKKYSGEENRKILRDIAAGRITRQVIELEDYPKRCLAELKDGVILLVFFDSLNYIIRDSDAETAEKIQEVAGKYEEIEMTGFKKYAHNKRKMQKVRGYFHRHIINIEKNVNTEKSLCDVWEFLDNFVKGASDYINGLGYKLKFENANKNNLFIHRLNESDFLTLNFILTSYALSKSVFGDVNIKFDTKGAAAVVYEFDPGTDFKDSGNLDLELAVLIAENNNMKIEFKTGGEKSRICVYFISSGGLAQIAGYGNIIKAEDIAERAEIELAFLRVKLK